MVSADEVERKLLSEEWTEMTDLEVDQFLSTPGLCAVDANESLQELNGDIPEIVEKMEGDGLNVENVDNVEGLDENPDLNSIDNNDYEFFDNYKTEGEFVLYSGPKYYMDFAYDHFYINDFTNDIFY